MSKIVLLATFLAIASIATSKELPENFKKCKRDETAEECLKVAIQDALPKLSNGLPQFKVPQIEPFSVPSLTIAAGTGSVQVVQYFKNVKVEGITKGTIKDVKVKINEEAKTVEFVIDTFLDKLTFNADYNMNGKLLILPVAGKGKCTIELTDLNTVFTSKGELVERHGVEYLMIKDVKVTLKPSNLIYRFDNLFKGDKTLGDEVNKILNANPLEVFADVRSGYEEFMGLVIKDITNRIYSQVPYSKLLAA